MPTSSTSDARPRLVITGGTGLLATNWALAKRHEWAITLLEHTKRSRVAGVRTIPLALDDPATIARALEEIDPHLVVHTVALTDVDRCEAEPSVARYVNVELARNVAEACRQHGSTTLIHISSDQLFSGTKPMVAEDEPPAPLNTYGRTKQEAELEVLEKVPDALVVRTNFYGWGHSSRTSFSDWIIRALRDGKPITMFEDVFFTPILTDHFIEVCHDLVRVGTGGIVHVAGSERVSKYEFAVTLAGVLGLGNEGIVRGSVGDADLGAPRPADMSLATGLVTDVLQRSMPTTVDGLEKLLILDAEGRREELRSAVESSGA